MGYFKFKTVSKVVDALVDNKSTVVDVMTNPVGAAATVVLTLGTMHFINEHRKRNLERFCAMAEQAEKAAEQATANENE